MPHSDEDSDPEDGRVRQRTVEIVEEAPSKRTLFAGELSSGNILSDAEAA